MINLEAATDIKNKTPKLELYLKNPAELNNINHYVS